MLAQSRIDSEKKPDESSLDGVANKPKQMSGLKQPNQQPGSGPQVAQFAGSANQFQPGFAPYHFDETIQSQMTNKKFTPQPLAQPQQMGSGVSAQIMYPQVQQQAPGQPMKFTSALKKQAPELVAPD